MFSTDQMSLLLAVGAIVVTLGVGTCSTNARIDDLLNGRFVRREPPPGRSERRREPPFRSPVGSPIVSTALKDGRCQPSFRRHGRRCQPSFRRCARRHPRVARRPCRLRRAPAVRRDSRSARSTSASSPSSASCCRRRRPADRVPPPRLARRRAARRHPPVSRRIGTSTRPGPDARVRGSGAADDGRHPRAGGRVRRHVVPEVRRHGGFPPEIPPALHDATSVTFDLDDANADLTGTITIVREEQTRT